MGTIYICTHVKKEKQLVTFKKGKTNRARQNYILGSLQPEVDHTCRIRAKSLAKLIRKIGKSLCMELNAVSLSVDKMGIQYISFSRLEDWDSNRICGNSLDAWKMGKIQGWHCKYKLRVGKRGPIPQIEFDSLHSLNIHEAAENESVLSLS